MTAQETFVANQYESTLSAPFAAGATTASVATTTGGPAVPCYLVVDPDVPAKTEVVLFTGSTALTWTCTGGNRGLDNTADVSHDAGAKVVCVPIAAMWADINDRVDGKTSTGHAHVEADISDLGSYTDAAHNHAGGDGAQIDHGGLAGLADFSADHGTGHDAHDHSVVAGTFRLDEVAAPAAAVNFADQQLTRPEIKDWAETIETHAAPGATETLDLANGNVQTITLDAATVTLTFSNPPATGKAGAFTLIVTQDATGGRLISWPASVDWAGGTAPTLSTAASAVDVLSFMTVDAGTRWYGFVAGQAMG